MSELLSAAQIASFSRDPVSVLSPLGGSVQKLDPHTTFLRQGLPVEHVFCLVEGSVKVEASDWDAKTLLICFSKPPTFFGDVEAFTAENLATCTVTTVTEAVLWRIDLARLRSRLGDHPWAAALLARGLSEKLQARAREAARNLLCPLTVRYEAYLNEMGAGGKPVPIALEDTAALLAVSPRHLQRVIAELVASGKVRRSGRSLVVI